MIVQLECFNVFFVKKKLFLKHHFVHLVHYKNKKIIIYLSVADRVFILSNYLNNTERSD